MEQAKGQRAREHDQSTTHHSSILLWFHMLIPSTEILRLCANLTKTSPTELGAGVAFLLRLEGAHRPPSFRGPA